MRGTNAPHRNMTTFLIEKEPGFGPKPGGAGPDVPPKIEKMGYKGVDTHRADPPRTSAFPPPVCSR